MPAYFDFFNRQEIPTITLCTPNLDEVYSLGEAYNRIVGLKYNALSSLEFDFPSTIDNGKTDTDAYPYLRNKMVIYVYGIGYYVIIEADENTDGENPIKHVVCNSLEFEFTNRRISGYSGTVPLYSYVGGVESVLSMALEKMPNWSIGSIDDILLTVYRTFEINNSTLYNFLITEVEKAFNCIIEFDFLNRTISARYIAAIVSDTNIYLSFENLIKTTEFNEFSDETTTAMWCYGGNGLDIRPVNPLGTNVIYNFDYYATTDWMTQGLIDSVVVWQNSVATAQADNEPTWADASSWSAPISIDTLPGSGNKQTQSEYIIGNTLVQSFWRNNVGYWRTVPIVSRTVIWASSSNWSNPISIDTMPGSGDMQSQTDYVLGNVLTQGFWRNNVGYWRTVPIIDNVIQWANARAWGDPLPISILPGSGNVQGQSDYILGNILTQTQWRNNLGYTRTVPVEGNVVQWTDASVWSDPIDINTLPGSGDMQSYSYYFIGSLMMESFWRNNIGYWRTVPIVTYTSLLTALQDDVAQMVVLESDLVYLKAQLQSMVTLGQDTYNQKTLITTKMQEVADLQTLMDTINNNLLKISRKLAIHTKDIYTELLSTLSSIQTSVGVMVTGWKDVYTSYSTYPSFDQDVFAAQEETIINLFSSLSNQLYSLRTYLDAGFSTYPPSSGELVVINDYLGAITDSMDSLYYFLRNIYPGDYITINLSTYSSQLNTYESILDYLPNFTESQYLELSEFIYENTYTNKNIILTDSMTPTEIQEQSQDLYNQSLDVLDRASEPRYEFSGDFVNFVALKEFENFANVLELGSVIAVEKASGITLEVTLLEMETNYDNPSESSFTFSNRLRINNANFIYADLFGQAVGSGVAIGKDAATSSTVGGWTVGTGGIGVPGAILSNIGYISFGNNPPTYYGNNVGAWLGFSGVAKISLYSNENNYLQWDGTKLLVKAQNFTLDANGNITATNATLSGTITATLGSIAGWTISSSQLYKTGAFINSSTPAIGLGTTTDYLTGTGFWVGQNSGIYKMHIGNPAGDNMRWDGSNLSATGYLQSTDSAVEFELMKMSFTNISWSQFAVFDALNDETKRLSPETSTYPAIVHFGGIDNGGDTTGDRIFGFNSKVYTNITTVYTGTSSAVGSGFLEDQYATWFDNQYTGFELVDSASTVFDIIGCTTDPFGTSWNILVVGTPTAGAYYIQSKIPTTAVAFCEFSDSTNGGTGTVILDVSFDGGVHYQAFLDTGSSVNLLGGSVLIANTGRDVCFKASVINDAGGDGAIIYKLLVAFDPSPWL